MYHGMVATGPRRTGGAGAAGAAADAPIPTLLPAPGAPTLPGGANADPGPNDAEPSLPSNIEAADLSALRASDSGRNSPPPYPLVPFGSHRYGAPPPARWALPM